MHIRPLALAIGLSLTALLAACSGWNQAPVASAPAQSVVDPAQFAAQLDAMYAEFWEASLKLNPLQATFIGDPRYNDQLPNFLSADYRQQAHDFTQQWLARAQTIDPTPLSGQARISYDIFVRDLKSELESERFPDWMQPINQFSSMASFAVQLGSGSSAQPFKTVLDYDNWLKRGDALVALFDQAIANMREGMAAGVVQPKVLMLKVLPQLDAVIKTNPEDSDFWGPITRMPADFNDADKQRLTAAYRTMIGDRLLPAYQRLRDFIASDYL
ncbi:MAG: hypothetical protein CVV17_13510, partial [Gammaproteobacteria bacterium HGW-Gammaproteobacteria-7]